MRCNLTIFLYYLMCNSCTWSISVIQKIYLLLFWCAWEVFREAKFKRVLRVHFQLILQKKLFVRHFQWESALAQIWLMISIESSDFLFWHVKQFWLRFLKLFLKIDTTNSIWRVFAHTLNFKIWNLVCLFLNKSWLKFFLMSK